MESIDKIAAIITACVTCVIIAIITVMALNDRLIAQSTDPVATACALGRESACIATHTTSECP